MNDPLASLDLKIDQILSLCQALRRENLSLRNRVADLEGQNRRLLDKVDAARGRLEGLMTRLPEQ